MSVKYVLFDVAGTLLYKPTILANIQQVLIKAGYKIEEKDLSLKHKLLSEVIHFPDKTDKAFYSYFNSELLFSLGIVPNEALLKAIFDNCSYLPWEKFEDTAILKEINVPIGIISNFNASLKNKLTGFFGDIFTDVFVSEQMGVAKPKLAFYERAIQQIKVNPENILYIGDSIKLDIKPAKELGIKTLLIDRHDFFPLHNDRILSLQELKRYL
jgi:HAD superfamily hydrolase (TIGR01509 family)